MSTSLFISVFVLLWIVPVIIGVIFAKKKNRSPHWMWFGIWPGVGLWVCIILLILKPLKICSTCGKKVSKDAKVCPYCTNSYNEIEKTEKQIEEEKNKSKRTTIITVTVVVLILSAFFSIISVSVFSSFLKSEPYQHSIMLIENNSELKEYLGEHYKRQGLISGSINVNGDSSGSAVISYKLKGLNGVSRVYIDAVKENGVWKYSKIMFYKRLGTSEVINLLSDQ